MEEEKNIGVGSFNIIESLYQPIKDQEKLFGDRKYNFFKENNVDPAELIGIQRDPNATVVQLNKDDPKNKEINFEYVKDVYNFVADLPDQALYRLVLGGMNGAKLGVNLLPAFSRLLGSEPGEDRFDDMYKFSQQADENIKNKITMFKDIYASAFKSEKGRDPNKASDFVSYIAQDYPYFAPIYSTLDKIGLPKTISVPLSVGLSSGVAFDPKQQTADGQSESSFFFDSASIKSLKEFFGALPDTPEGEVFDRAYQAFETTGVAAAIGPIINTALFLKRNVPAFNKAIPGGAVATGSATAIGEITDQTILNPQNETIQNQEPTILDNVRSGIDQFGNKLTQIGGAIKKEFSGEAMANPLVKKGVDELVPVFKSAVVDAVNKIPNKAPGDQILGTIKNVQGISQSEIKWIGLDDFLKGKPSVTKQEVSDFIQANRLDVNEVQFPSPLGAADERLPKKTLEQVMEDFEVSNSVQVEDMYMRAKDALEAVNNQRLDNLQYKVTRFDIQNPNGQLIDDRINVQKFMINSGLWDDFYERGAESMTSEIFKEKYKNTYTIFAAKFNETKKRISDESLNNLLNDFFDDYNPARTNKGAVDFQELILAKDEYLEFESYLKDKNFTIFDYDKNEISDDVLEKFFNEYTIRTNKDGLANYHMISFNDIEDALKSGQRETQFGSGDLVLPGLENYKELIFTLSKGGKNVGDDFPLQQGATKQQTVGSLNLDSSKHFNIPGEFAHVRFGEKKINGQKTLTVEEMQSDIFQEVKQVNKKTKNRIKDINNFKVQSEEITKQEADKLSIDEFKDREIVDFPFKNNWYELVTRRLVRYAADNGFDAIAIPEGKVAAARYYQKGAFVDKLEMRAVTSDKMNEAGYPEYTFFIDEMSGGKIVQTRSLKDAAVYNIDKSYPKKYQDILADAEDILLHKYTAEELKNKSFGYTFDNKEFIGKGKGKYELYDQAIPSYFKKYAKKWNAPIGIEKLNFDEVPITVGDQEFKSVNFVVLKITPEMKRSVQEKSQPLFNIVLPALSAGGGAKVISDNMENNTISNPTKN